MGIEEIKKAKEEAKKTFTRPSQKVAALLIALGPATASEILKNIKDEDLLEQITLEMRRLLLWWGRWGIKRGTVLRPTTLSSRCFFSWRACRCPSRCRNNSLAERVKR